VELKVYSEPVAAPRLLGSRPRMTDLTAALRRCGYDLNACARRLGVLPRLGVNFWQPLHEAWKPRPADAVDTLLELLIDGRPVAADRLSPHLAPAELDALIETRLVEVQGGQLSARLCLFPIAGKYLATDRADRNKAVNQVMYLWSESYLLGGLVKRSPRRRAIDLGTGSGVHAILAADHCQRVVAVDINPRALEFARFNAALNGVENIDFVQSDLWSAVEGSCDLLLANPPYAPDTAAMAGDNFWSGGVLGTDLLRRIVEALPDRLDADGACHLNALFPNPPRTRTRDHFDAWLGGALARYQVLDHSWPVPHYTDLLSEQPFKGDMSAWRFGVVSLRLAPAGPGWWREVAGKGFFFRPDGSCALTADHDAG
jgi:SAM-dependent methyltransferase